MNLDDLVRRLHSQKTRVWNNDSELIEARNLLAEAALAIEGLRKDAERFNALQNMPVVEAQAFFWNYASRKRREEAIDTAIRGKSE